MFANDVKLLGKRAVVYSCKLIQADLNSAAVWCALNRLQLSLSKCGWLVYGVC